MARCGVAATLPKVIPTIPLLLPPVCRANLTPSPGIVRLMGPGGPAMVRSAMSKRFPAESPEAVEKIAPYMYQITAAQGSGEYALNLLLEPGAWARRPLCERLLPLQGSVRVISRSLGVVCVAGVTHARSASVFRVRQQRLDGPPACARPRVEACCPCICESCSSVYFIKQIQWRCACLSAGNVAAGSRCVEQWAPHVRAPSVSCVHVAVTCASNRYLENSVEFNSTMQHILAEQPVPM